MSRAGTLVVIKWRDIPAQVLAKRGRETVRVKLPARFTAAVDRAAMAAGKTTADDYLEDWNRESRPCGDDLHAEVDAEAERLAGQYPREVLNELVANYGYRGTQ